MEQKDNPPEKAPEGLSNLIKTLSDQPSQNGAPVHLWNPPFCGNIDLVIKRDGSWIYNKTPIGRQKLVRLFASVLKRENDSFYLVTPVEKIGITVEDAPFNAIAMDRRGQGQDQILSFTTNVGDTVIAGDEHKLRFEPQPIEGTLLPYIHIRAGLDARLARPVYYELANLAENLVIDGSDQYGIWSSGEFFPLSGAASL